MLNKTRTEAIALVASPEAINAAVGWLEDCFEDLPADLTKAEIVAGVDRHFDGGWWTFVEVAV
jgi:hypothetical protein